VLFGDSVPNGFAARIQAWFRHMNDRCSGTLQKGHLDQLAIPTLMPPENFITAQVHCEAVVPAVAWRVMCFVKSRVPHCMRGLLEAGVTVLPWGLADNRVISQGVYAGLDRHEFGYQSFDGIYLCRMQPAQPGDDFYPTLFYLPNVPLCISVNRACATVATIPRLVVIMRGIPGSGKSTFVQKLQRIFPDLVICSSDLFFELQGSYQFNRTQLGAAHDFCHQAFRTAIVNGANHIVVDNTSIRSRDYRDYITIGSEAGYRVQVVDMLVGGYKNVLECHRRNVHQVPLETLVRMNKHMQHDETAFAVSNMPDCLATQSELEANLFVLDYGTSDKSFAGLPCYAAVFLTEESRSLLLSKMPPQHAMCKADHITLAFTPTSALVASLPVGTSVTFTVTGFAVDQC